MIFLSFSLCGCDRDEGSVEKEKVVKEVIPFEAVSYYISEDHVKVRFARLMEVDCKELDSTEELAVMPEMEPLESAPFESRFFEEGHKLLEVSPLFHPLIEKGAPGFQAVLNESTGRLVVRGTAGQQFLVKNMTIRKDYPIQIQSEFDLYLIPPATDLASAWNLEFLPKGWEKLKSISGIGRPGQKVLLRDDRNELEMEISVYADSRESSVDFWWSLKLDTEIKGEKVELKSSAGSAGLSGVARLVDLGSFGIEGKRLCVVQKLGIQLLDGTSIDDLVWNETPGIPFHYDDMREYIEGFGSSFFESEAERPFGMWPLPPTFLNFISSGSEPEGDAEDPFSEDAGEGLAGRFKKGPGGAIDMKELFKLQGVEFEKEDTAYFFANRGLLVVHAKPATLELVGAISIAAGSGPPRWIELFVGLIESSDEPDLDALLVSKAKVLSHGSISGRPGQLAGWRLKSEGQLTMIELEPQIGANDDLIDIRLEGMFQLAGEKEISIKSGVTLKEGEPAILSKFRLGEKWRAVVISGEIGEVLDELPE